MIELLQSYSHALYCKGPIQEEWIKAFRLMKVGSKCFLFVKKVMFLFTSFFILEY